MRSKEPLPGDLAVCIAISALAAVSFLITPSSLHWLARPVVFFALFSLLCYSLLAVVFPRQGDLLPQARAGLSAAAGLGGAILAALSSGLLREWHLLALAVLLGLLTIASAVYARQLRISLPRRKRYTLATRQGFTPIRPGGVVRRRSPLQRHLPALAIVVLALALTFALGYFALPDRGPGITRLNILGDDNRPDVYSGSVVAGRINPAGSSPASPAGAASAAAALDGSNLSDNRSDVEVLAGGQSPNSTNNSTNNQTGVSGRAAIPQRRPAFGGGGGSTASTTSTTTSTQARAIEPDPSRLAAIENLELDEEEPEVDDEVEDLEAAEEVEVAEEEPLSIEDNQSQAASVGNDSPAVSPQAPASAPAPSPAGLDGAREVNVSPAGAGAAGLTEAEVPDDQRPAGGDVNQPPIVTDLRPDLASPQRAGPKVTWTARASDPEDPILYRFYLNGLPVTGWSSSQNWTWPTSGWKPGEYRVKVWVRDGNHAPANENDGWMETPFVISSDNQPPVLEGLTPDPASPHPAGARITWTAGAEDPEDTVLYRFAVDGQPTTSWSPSPIWVWQTEGLEPGEHQISAWARDGSHAGEDGFDSALSSTFRLIAPAEEVQAEASGLAATGGALERAEEVPVEAEGVEEEQAGDSQPPEPANQPPSLSELLADPVSPQTRGTLITWTAVAEDPEDAVLYRFLQNGQAVTGWTASRNWSWDTSESLPGEYRISVRVRDGRHAGEEGFDSSLDAVFTISSAIDQEIDRLMQGRGLGASQDTTEAIASSGVQVADANQPPRQAVLGKSRPASGDQGAPAMVRVGR